MEQGRLDDFLERFRRLVGRHGDSVLDLPLMARMSGPHMDAILARHGMPPKVFIESGTFHGKTTRLAVERFREVHTIELHPDWYRQAVEQLGPLGVICHEGNSALLIPQLAQQIQEPVAWYLDSHFFKIVPDVAGEKEGLPLWTELHAVAMRPYRDIVMVDDVHAFGKSEPTPEWLEVSLESIAACFPTYQEAVIMGDQAVIFR